MFPHPYTACELQELRNAEFHRQAAADRLSLSASSRGPAMAGLSPTRLVRAALRSILALVARRSLSSHSNRPAAA